MALFIGEYRSKIDAKGRIVFPSAFKYELFLHSEKRLVIQKDFYQKCLSMYTVEAWAALANEMKSRLNLLNKEQAEFWRTFMSNRAEVTPDEISGRIIIPRRLFDMIEATDEVVFIGFDDHIEVWSAPKFESSTMNEEEFAQAAEKFLG
ncbi:MAG: cell division/cell wall cluster transcriptional repressor MraZ [Prevotellaceae bacterium]|jgi:MraZ protein|nr:cell division/cell wall cluster transcriptional repressor MraZ [Prevotellaceae bacterium]